MGFPTWTLWGMGLAALGALVSILLAFIAQTPRLLARLGLVGARLDLRARAFTGYGLAFLLLAGGFFLAGVPLGGEGSATTQQTTSGESLAAGAELPDDASGVAGTITAEDSATQETAAEPEATTTPSSGMVARPRDTETPQPGAEALPTESALTGATGETGTTPASTEIAAAAPAPAAEATTTPSATPPPPSPTPTPSPTATPTPTMTPTPIDGATARVGENIGALPVRDKPNGEPIATIYRGDTVLLLPGRAFHTGGVWREISTVDGVVGWVQDLFLDYGG